MCKVVLTFCKNFSNYASYKYGINIITEVLHCIKSYAEMAEKSQAKNFLKILYFMLPITMSMFLSYFFACLCQIFKFLVKHSQTSIMNIYQNISLMEQCNIAMPFSSTCNGEEFR